MVYPYFRFWYPKSMGLDNKFPSEDIFFTLACGNAGIEVYCDTTVVSPHLTVGTVQEDTWLAYLKDHPEFRQGGLEDPAPEDLKRKLGAATRMAVAR